MYRNRNLINALQSHILDNKPFLWAYSKILWNAFMWNYKISDFEPHFFVALSNIVQKMCTVTSRTHTHTQQSILHICTPLLLIMMLTVNKSMLFSRIKLSLCKYCELRKNETLDTIGSKYGGCNRSGIMSWSWRTH